jgi:hypothetical protein
MGDSADSMSTDATLNFEGSIRGISARSSKRKSTRDSRYTEVGVTDGGLKAVQRAQVPKNKFLTALASGEAVSLI